MLIISVQDNIKENIELLRQISQEEYNYPHAILGYATIGEHMRHIIEFLGTIVTNYENGIINYNKRKRDINIQTNKSEAIKLLLKYQFELDKPNKSLYLEHYCSSSTKVIQTNYFRELLYNLEHSIHHQALIKIALHNSYHITIPESFGVAHSTLEFRSQCVQ